MKAPEALVGRLRNVEPVMIATVPPRLARKPRREQSYAPVIAVTKDTVVPKRSWSLIWNLERARLAPPLSPVVK